jgi:outer membrane lipoprotein-sorting protein
MLRKTMLRKTELAGLYVGLFLALAVSCAAGADTGAGLSAPAIVDKNISARGGLQAWRAVQTLSMSGKLDAGGNNRPALQMPAPGGRRSVAMPPPRPAEQVQLPFVMDLQRSRKSRVEIEFQGKKAIQVFDGTNGWKLRPFLNRHEVENYTADEMKATALQADLDGPLVDFAAKGTHVELEGHEKVRDRDTYKLKLTLSNGQTQHIWIDTKTFLEAKIEGTPRRLDGKMHAVATYPSDFRPVSGIVMPYLLETIAEGTKQTEKIQIDNITVNPKFDPSAFAKPN